MRLASKPPTDMACIYGTSMVVESRRDGGESRAAEWSASSLELGEFYIPLRSTGIFHRCIDPL
jgi:hypothetical protein